MIWQYCNFHDTICIPAYLVFSQDAFKNDEKSLETRNFENELVWKKDVLGLSLILSLQKTERPDMLWLNVTVKLNFNFLSERKF